MDDIYVIIYPNVMFVANHIQRVKLYVANYVQHVNPCGECGELCPAY